MESHLLQMRGLKHQIGKTDILKAKSHLLQMRGLKLLLISNRRNLSSRIFYRCVD